MNPTATEFFVHIVNDNNNRDSTNDINRNTTRFVTPNSATESIIQHQNQQSQPRNITIISDSKKFKTAIRAHDNETLMECLSSGRYGINARDSKNNNTACHLAVLANNQEAIKIFHDYNANINEVNTEGDTPLILAVKNDNSEMIECLLANGANINKLNGAGYSALTFAIKLKNKPLVKKLINYNADVNIADNQGFIALFHAIETANLDIITELLYKRNNIHHQDVRGCTVIHLATQIKDNNNEIIDLLLKNRADINAKDKNGKTPLHYAYLSNKVEVVSHLIHIGADINATDNCDSTVLHFLAKNINHQAAVTLLENTITTGFNINILDTENNSALYYAIKNKNFAFINKLLSLDASIFFEYQEKISYLSLILLELDDHINILSEATKNNTDNIINQTLLSCLKNIEKLWSEQYHHTTSITYLIIYNNLRNLLNWIYNNFSNYSAFKFDCSNKDDKGFCPIHTAIQLDKLDAIKILLDNNININAIDRNGRTALHHAVEHKKNTTEHLHVIKLLLEHNIKLDIQDTDGNTAIFYACKNNDFLAINILLDAGAKIDVQNINNENQLKILIEKIEIAIQEINNEVDDIKNNTIIDILKHIANLDLKDSLIHFLIKNSYLNTFKKLINLATEKQIKINFEQKDTEGNTLLHHAAYKLDENIAMLLIKGPVKIINLINSKNTAGMTALHCAAESTKGENFVQFLLNFCAAFNIKDNKDRTALHYAAQSNNIKTIKLLIDNGANIDSKDKSGKTPLHNAVMHASEDAVKLLIDSGADASLEDTIGLSAFHRAITLGYKPAIKCIIANNKELSVIDGTGDSHLQKLIKLL